MRVLLDTCVISELRHPKGSPRVKAAVQQLEQGDLFLSAITIGELTKGVGLLNRGSKKTQLSRWLQMLRQHYCQRVLPIDYETALIWGELAAKARKAGHGLGVSDGLIAASAIQHGLHLMTRNVSDFQTTGALLLNPWE